MGKLEATKADPGAETVSSKPLLHLVFGGRVKDPQGLEFEDLDDLDIVGIFPNYREAFKAWQAASQAHVDDAQMKYVIVHLHRLLQPEDLARGRG